jgi:hypothetical protein
MKKIIVLAVVAITSQAVAIFAGEPTVSSKQVITPPPPPEFFRPNEAGYDLVNGASNNFIQTNFGLRYAF